MTGGASDDQPLAPPEQQRVPLATIARQWLRIGCTGFGGPPAHIALLRDLCVRRTGWLTSDELEHGIAAANLLPGPASTQLAIYCAWRLRRTAGAVLGGVCFIAPGLIVILALSALFLSAHPPVAVEGAAAGAGAVVPVVALRAASDLVAPSWRRAGADRAGADRTGAERAGADSGGRAGQARWIVYAAAGAAAGALAGEYLVLVLAACGLIELSRHLRAHRPPSGLTAFGLPGLLAAAGAGAGGLGALAWVAFKVGALSYGGSFVIVPLMQSDAVNHYHWMTGSQFLGAVALGQLTPGPVVQTVAVVGYAAAGVGGGLLAAAVAFTPSFCFVLAGAPHFDRIRTSARVQAFLGGAGPAAIGAIGGAAIPLGLELTHVWEVAVLAGAAVWLIAARRNIVSGLVGGGLIGVAVALGGLPVPR